MRAFQFLFRHANLHLAGKIGQCEIRFNQLKYYKKALAGRIKDELGIDVSIPRRGEIAVLSRTGKQDRLNQGDGNEISIPPVNEDR